MVADTSIDVIFGMTFLFFSNANVKFTEKELIWRIYSASDALPTTKQIQLIDRKKLAAAALNLSKEAFVVHVAYFKAKMSIHLTREAQIALLLAKKVTVSDDYSDFADIFSKKLAAKLSKCSNINK